MEHICLSLWSSQDLTSLPIYKFHLMIARAGARELGQQAGQLLQTMHLELVTQDSRIWESICFGSRGSGGSEPCAREPCCKLSVAAAPSLVSRGRERLQSHN